ncbi:flagellar assembly protein FliW [Microbacterium sp. RU33B]|uniref:flagellar assembly protein FliW n=1 Tax=Microbacterium sp. RU33B TaxID=1907390 RepID=UPI00095B63D0|nr:flagellar assembly protein FliW [Microbacterium sp. RU33B]SIT83167.1 flagellar assembly factor FliW [Microbacterium sp. RU33B]
MSAVLQFVAPPPGLSPHTAFELDQVSEVDGLFSLQALEDASVRLFLVDPRDVAPDYAPVLSDEQTDLLLLLSPDDALLLVVAQLTADGLGVNLLAPVVVNQRTGVAAQLILEGQDFPLRALLP